MNAPLDAMALSPETLASIEAYHLQRNAVVAVFDALIRSNAAIGLVKEQAAAARVATIQAIWPGFGPSKHVSLSLLRWRAKRISTKAAKAATEVLRGQVHDALDNYRQNIFPAYEAAINDYLHGFNAGFRLGGIGSANTRAGSSCIYNVLINNKAVALTAAAGPSLPHHNERG